LRNSTRTRNRAARESAGWKSHAKHTDEQLNLEDLRRATKVIARTPMDQLALIA
jgi:hypothetical protein